MIQREASLELIRQAKNHAISVITGSRQVGKSTLMHMLETELAIPSTYYNLENPLHLALFDEGYTSFIRQNRTNLIFIDEFHLCKDISKIFKAIYDLNPLVKIYASGSSSLEMQAHLKESLAGRKLEKTIFPLTFSEWLGQFKPPIQGIPPLEEPSPIDTHETLSAKLREFLLFGAMPGLIGLETEIEKREYLFGIYQTYIAKDIKSFLKDESVQAFNKMISYLALNNATQLNKNTLANLTRVSSRQVDRHIEILQGTHVIALLPPLSQNKGKELVKTSKFYLYDQGVLNAIIQDFRPLHLRQDIGSINEQFVFWELKKRMDIRHSLKYWRTTDGKEVDFILEKDREYLPIEVKTSWPSDKIPPGIIHFFSAYPETKQALILYDGPETTCVRGDRTVFFAPMYKACKALELMEPR